MMKRFVSLMVLLATLFALTACGGEQTPKTTETTPPDYATAVTAISDAIQDIDSCAKVQHDWLGVSNNLPYLYSDSNYTGGNNDEAKQAGTDCFNYRKTANEKMDLAKSIIKGGEGSYYDAVLDYYLAASEFLSFVSNFPEGYNKITWGEKLNELRQNCSTAKAKVEIYE